MLHRLESQAVHDGRRPRPGTIAVECLQRGVQFRQFERRIAPLGLGDRRHHAPQLGVPVQHELDRRAVARLDFLLHVRDLQAVRNDDVAAIRLQLCADGRKQTRLPGSVSAGEPDLVAAKYREVDLLEQRLRTAPQGEIPGRQHSEAF